MAYETIKNELNTYYFNELPKSAEAIRANVFSRMDSYVEEHPNESSYRLKAKLYESIADEIAPVIFPDLPFFFETGALVAFSDGNYGRGATHANGWLYLRNMHLFRDIDPYAYELYRSHKAAGLYIQSGKYADMLHLGLPTKKLFSIGLCGVLAELKKAEKDCVTEQEKEFISSAIAGITALCTIAKKFALAAREAGQSELASIAERVPMNPPKTLHEGLCVLAFLRKALGALEGMGFNSFGRVDVLLAPLYENDLRRGVSHEALLELVTKFLLIWNCTLDRSKKMEGPYDYEMENSLTLGGCDADGNPVFNGVTRLFLEAREKETILVPKMMLRFSEHSPEEYLALITKPLLASQSLSLFENDDALIPALVASGIAKEDAYDYAVGGCWDILLPNVAIHNSGEYFNLLKPLEWSIHENTEAMEKIGFVFESLEQVSDFDELYQRYLGFLRRVLVQKAAITARGSSVWHKVNPVCAISALMEPCIPQKLDVTAGGGAYNRETAYLAGFAEAVDSLLAIRKLCFEDKICTLRELFEQCRSNWKDEILRAEAIRAPSWGDGSEESSHFAARFVDDVYEISRGLPTAQAGEFRLGSNLYTETIRWGNVTPAMPNGRKLGDYMAQGLTPSRCQRTITLADLLYSFRAMDMKKFPCSASVTVNLPAGRMEQSQVVAFFRAAAQCGLLALQPNCVSIQDLIAAKKEPEKYGHIIVRVCGFSAPFVSLAEYYQDEFISRMMLDV